jgi:hypothetical protein
MYTARFSLMDEVPSFEKVPVFTLAVRPSVLTVLHLSSSLLLLDVEEVSSAQPAGKSPTVRGIAFAAAVSSGGVGVGFTVVGA